MSKTRRTQDKHDLQNNPKFRPCKWCGCTWANCNDADETAPAGCPAANAAHARRQALDELTAESERLGLYGDGEPERSVPEEPK